jgi:hypothetical protein
MRRPNSPSQDSCLWEGRGYIVAYRLTCQPRCEPTALIHTDIMAGRRTSEAEYKLALGETRTLVERLCLEVGGSIPPSVLGETAGWSLGTVKNRLRGAVERGLLRHHRGGTYSPAVDAEGRPMRLVLVVEEGGPKSA